MAMIKLDRYQNTIPKSFIIDIDKGLKKLTNDSNNPTEK